MRKASFEASQPEKRLRNLRIQVAQPEISSAYNIYRTAAIAYNVSGLLPARQARMIITDKNNKIQFTKNVYYAEMLIITNRNEMLAGSKPVL